MSATPAQLETVSRLLNLERALRHAETPQELAYLIVNTTRNLIDYRQAVLWRKDNAEFVGVSGIAEIDPHAPYLLWLGQLCKELAPRHTAKFNPVTSTDLSPPVAEQWPQWLPAQALWIPFYAYIDGCETALLLARQEPWDDHELFLLEHLADSFAHAWRCLQPRPAFWQKPLSVRRIQIVAVVAAVALVIPVRLTALAPATVIATEPTIIRAPVDGVVDRFVVQPNDTVSQEQLLVALDEQPIKNELSVAQKALAIAEAEYRKTAQQAVNDRASMAQLNVLKSRVAQEQAEVERIDDWLMRTQIKAPHPGVAIFSDTDDWEGRPVKLGERMLMIADPKNVELEIQLPIADAINLKSGAKVLMFLNIAPINPLKAVLYYSAYQAHLTDDDNLAYRLKARLAEATEAPRIGLKGTAKVFGKQVPLIYYLLRKPLAVLRQWTGF